MEKWNEDKHLLDILTTCEVQAMRCLENADFNSPIVQDEYKKLVKTFYKLHLQIEDEITNPKKLNIKVEDRSQKNCPKCGAMIPTLFTYHTCGWKG